MARTLLLLACLLLSVVALPTATATHYDSYGYCGIDTTMQRPFWYDTYCAWEEEQSSRIDCYLDVFYTRPVPEYPGAIRWCNINHDPLP